MKISRRSFLKVAGAAGMAGALAACGGASSSTAASSAAASGSASAANGDVTIRMTWWGGQTRHDLTQKVLQKGTVWLAPQFSAIHAWHRAPMRDAGKFKMQLVSMGRYFKKWGCGKGTV